MKTLSISIHDENNLGDQVCNPTDYFDLPNVEKVDAWDWGQWMCDTESNMIFGGGGLIHGILAQAISHVQRNPRRKLIAWGLGHNQHGETTNDYAGSLNGFDLIGVRDFRRAQFHGWDYVPCASCMHQSFNNNFVPLREHGVLCHHEHPILMCSNWPVLTWTNQRPKSDFPKMLDFIDSCAKIVTNSYHGAYWAMLLRRAVMIYKPFSSRFHDFKHQPVLWGEHIKAFSHTPPDYLHECRNLNQNFYEKVKELLRVRADGIIAGGSVIRDVRIHGVSRVDKGAQKEPGDNQENRDVP